MASDKKVTANRKNAKASTGPRSGAGKRRSSRNAVQHGLAVTIESDPGWQDGVEILAKVFCSTMGDPRDPVRCLEASRAAIDLLRIRQIRSNILRKLSANRGADDYYSDLNGVLAKLDRYERRAISRRKRAFSFADAR